MSLTAVARRDYQSPSWQDSKSVKGRKVKYDILQKDVQMNGKECAKKQGSAVEKRRVKNRKTRRQRAFCDVLH